MVGSLFGFSVYIYMYMRRVQVGFFTTKEPKALNSSRAAGQEPKGSKSSIIIYFAKIRTAFTTWTQRYVR